MPRSKIHELFPEKYELKQKLEKDWQNFLIRDPYLIHDVFLGYTICLRCKFLLDFNKFRRG